MEEDDLVNKTNELNISQGGGGGPTKKFTFSSNAPAFNPNAFEFIPSWEVKEPEAEQEYYEEQEENQQAYVIDEKPKSNIPTKKISEAPAKAVSLSIGGSSKPAAETSAVSSSSRPVKEKVSSTDTLEKKEAKKEVIMEVEEEVDMSGMTKEHLNLIFIGHVDAGKSTMGGHILFLTGMVDKRTMEKYEREAKEAGRESWYLSWALDLNAEERNKGKTTEYGRGYFETEKRRFTIIDAPGHKTFVPSMIEGAAQADIGILVISARKGEFETGFEKGGQTREHALLAKTAGVKRLIMVINKMDESTVQWSKER